MTKQDDIREALKHVDSTDRETWLRMGAGIKSEFGQDGFSLWDEWSQKAENYNEKSGKIGLEKPKTWTRQYWDSVL